LLPCPFCGSDDLYTDNARDFIACCNCGTEGPVGIGQGSAHNIARWNVRAALAAPGQAPQPLPDVELVAAAVHQAWIDAKRAAGIQSRPAADGREQMVPYAELDDDLQELDRATVKAVYAAIAAARPQAQPTPTDTPT
jgi:Lar family restriction alleviation protein